MDAEANDPACVLIHDHKDSVGLHRRRFTAADHAPEAVFVCPGKSTGKDHQSPVPVGSDGRESCELRLCRFDVERQGDLLCDSGQPQLGLRRFISTTVDELCAGTFGTGLPMAVR